MDRVSQEELIEAFFDGELTGVDRRQAEDLLVESDAARRWLKQLRAMHAVLGQLPRQTLPDGFAESVLRRAEQAMLKSPKPASHSHVAVAADPDQQVSLRRETWLRIWIGVAVAATALFVVVLPDYFQRQRNNVAFNDAVAPTASIPSETPSPPIDGLYYERTTNDFDDRAKLDGSRPAATEELRKESGGESSDRLNKRYVTTPAGAGGFGFEAQKAGVEQAKPMDAPSIQGKLARDEESRKDEWAEGDARAVVSFVYDVSSAEAQQVVLKKFEQTLREQQIELEDTPLARTERSRFGSGSGGGGSGGSGLGGGGMPTTRALGNRPVADQPATLEDRVYVVEATPLQVSNTINSLNNLAAPRSGQAPARRADNGLAELKTAPQMAQPQPPGEKQAKEMPAQRPTDPASQSANFYNNAIRNGYAYRLSTDFTEQSGNESGRPGQALGAAPSPAKNSSQNAQDALKTAPPPAPTTTAPGSPARTSPVQQLAEPNSEKLQRAVIIFRVVPPADAKADADRPR